VDLRRTGCGHAAAAARLAAPPDGHGGTVIKDFRNFLLRGNVIDLAVAVIIGAAFGAVVKSFTDDILMALIAAIFGQPTFQSITIDVGDGQVFVGRFINAVITFVIVGFALFIVIKSFETLQERRRRGELAPEETPAPTDEAVLLAEIRDLLKQRA
jgi:large conductance mechanosensitive channel